MTTATEHHDAQLAAIKARHAEFRAQINNPALSVGAIIHAENTYFHQLGLEDVKVDQLGRLWSSRGVDGLELVFDPGDLAKRVKFIESFLVL